MISDTQCEALEMVSALGPKAFKAFGDRAQYIKAIEELSELTQVLCKRLNGAPCENIQIIDEIADVLVMANQLRLHFDSKAIDYRMIYKMNRIEQFMERLDHDLGPSHA